MQGFAAVTPEVQQELETTADAATGGDVITRPEFSKKGNLVRICGCTNTEFDFEPIEPDLMRQKSNSFLQGGAIPSTDGWSNLLWAWGQFIDHDLVATTEDKEPDDPSYDAVINRGGRSEIMTLHRLTVDEDGVCRSPVVVNSPQIDASMIYGSPGDEGYLMVCMLPFGLCKYNTSASDCVPACIIKHALLMHHRNLHRDRLRFDHKLKRLHTEHMYINKLCGHADCAS